jgi:UDP-glucose 4-epimerase
MESIGVVGSKGFIGSELVRHLDELGYRVLPFDSNNRPFSNTLGLNRSISFCDTLIWCASRVTPYSAEANPNALRSELSEWKSFISSLEALPISPFIIFLSSGGCAYEAGTPPFSEHNLARGSNQYGKHKIALEEYLQQSALEGSILRLANVYGPTARTGRGQGVVTEWFNSILNGTSPLVYGPMDSVRDYVYIDDVLRAIHQSVIRKEDSTFNISSGTPTSLNEIWEIIKFISCTKLNLEAHGSRTVDRMDYYLDISKAKKYLDWEPQISIEDGLKRTWLHQNSMYLNLGIQE